MHSGGPGPAGVAGGGHGGGAGPAAAVAVAGGLPPVVGMAGAGLLRHRGLQPAAHQRGLCPGPGAGGSAGGGGGAAAGAGAFAVALCHGHQVRAGGVVHHHLPDLDEHPAAGGVHLVSHGVPGDLFQHPPGHQKRRRGPAGDGPGLSGALLPAAGVYLRAPGEALPAVRVQRGIGYVVEVRRGRRGHRRGGRLHRRAAVRGQGVFPDDGPAGLDGGDRGVQRGL